MTIRAEAIFCDDMRSEANGKIILIGVYRHYMGVTLNARPLLPKLTAVLLVDYSADLVGSLASIRVMNADVALVDVPMTLAPAPPPNPVTRPGDMLAATIPIELIPFQPEDGMCLRVEFDCGDFHFRSPNLEIRGA